MCGLSGVGHGLMGATAILLVRSGDRPTKRLGFFVTSVVISWPYVAVYVNLCAFCSAKAGVVSPGSLEAVAT